MLWAKYSGVRNPQITRPVIFLALLFLSAQTSLGQIVILARPKVGEFTAPLTAMQIAAATQRASVMRLACAI